MGVLQIITDYHVIMHIFDIGLLDEVHSKLKEGVVSENNSSEMAARWVDRVPPPTNASINLLVGQDWHLSTAVPQFSGAWRWRFQACLVK